MTSLGIGRRGFVPVSPWRGLCTERRSPLQAFLSAELRGLRLQVNRAPGQRVRGPVTFLGRAASYSDIAGMLRGAGENVHEGNTCMREKEKQKALQ
ncbi:hypothetical protein NDU88_005783 [Pleurodeles waltl]|uniref:Uncharacterized protein n=1 Tax=Pleurodeles waltl TaxID=8319 RepID=A0AAV7TV89_PLEWA|nr:hypothetical protein NDU88_005783 [Pleurodeles waltl]